jgi:hypothetical protein
MIETGDRRFGILRSRFLARRHTALLVATGETISMSISIYLLLGLTWGVLYMVICQFDPQAIAFGAASGSTPASPENQLHMFPILTYFSLTTLSTILRRAAKLCKATFHKRHRLPLLPPPSAVINKALAWG